MELSFVMAGLDQAIHVFDCRTSSKTSSKSWIARNECGHDSGERGNGIATSTIVMRWLDPRIHVCFSPRIDFKSGPADQVRG